MAAVSLAILLGTALVGPGRSLAHPAHDLPAGGYIFAGMEDGHAYRSADGGATWQEADAGLPEFGEINPRSPITALVVAPDGSTVYAATQGSGLWASPDDGTSWQPADGGGEGAVSPDANVAAVAVDPLDGQHVVAASYDGTFYQSTDGGLNWSIQILPLGYVTTMALDPQRPSTILVGTGSGLLVSTDGGATWTKASDVPASAYVYSVAADPHFPDLAYAAGFDHLYRTVDGGRTWQQEDLSRVFRVAVDPSGLAGVLAGSSFGEIARSHDGVSWHLASGLELGYTHGINAFTFDPARPARVLAATDSGMRVSTDSGGSWHAAPAPGGGDQGRVTCLASTARIPLPSDPVDPPSDLSHTRYFPATRHSLRDPFLTFWDRHGNGPLFGSPITEPFTEDGRLVQYFERALLSYSGGHVSVDPLGAMYTADRHFTPRAPSTNTAARYYFLSTGHTLAAPFLAYWARHEGRLTIGPPISEPLREQNGDGTGRFYLVQYFQNMRLEYHPELAGTPYMIGPGLIGRQLLHQRGWI